MENLSRSDLDRARRSDLSKKERRELRRQEKEKSRTQEMQKARVLRIIKWILIAAAAAAVLAGVYYLLNRGEKDLGSDLSEAVSILGRDHVAPSAAVTNYNSNPPTSGSHWSDEDSPAARGVHKEEVPDEAMVHNLEHGEIWISYRPEIPESVKEELRKITSDSYKVVLTVRSKNDTDIALASWGRLDKFNLDGKPLDVKRIEDFISRYQNKGPELIP